MNYFRFGDRIRIKKVTSFGYSFAEHNDSGIVIGYATLQSGVPCLIVNMDCPDMNGLIHTHLLVAMDNALPL